MQVRNVVYAAVGAPVVAARKVSGQVSTIRDKVGESTTSYTKAAEKTFNSWAVEGEKFVNRLGEGKVVGEISSKVDLDQAKEQVSKLRDQLEEMLATWRTSFRPEKAEEATSAPAAAPTAKKPAAKKPAAKKPAAKSSTAKPSTTKSSATKTGTGSSSSKTSTETAKAS